MKIALIFDEEDAEFRAKCATHGLALWGTLWDVDQICRDRLKYGEDVSDEEERVLERIRDEASLARTLEDMN